MVETHLTYTLNISSSINPADYPKSIHFDNFPWISTISRVHIIIHYSLVLAAIYRKFINNGAFYYIFFVSGLFDVIHFFIVIIYTILEECVRGPDFTLLYHMSTFLDALLFVVNIVLNGLMVVNRFSATFFNYEKIWKQPRVKIYSFLCTLSVVIIVAPVFLRTRTFTIQNGAWVYTFDQFWNRYIRWVVTSTLSIYEFLGVILGVLAVNRLRIRIRIRSDKIEKSLFTVTLIHLFLSIPLICYQLTKTYNWPETIVKYVNLYVLYFGMDAFVYVNSITIILTNRKVRDEFLEISGLRKSKLTTIFVSGNSNNVGRAMRIYE